MYGEMKPNISTSTDFWWRSGSRKWKKTSESGSTTDVSPKWLTGLMRLWSNERGRSDWFPLTRWHLRHKQGPFLCKSEERSNMLMKCYKAEDWPFGANYNLCLLTPPLALQIFLLKILWVVSLRSYNISAITVTARTDRKQETEQITWQRLVLNINYTNVGMSGKTLGRGNDQAGKHWEHGRSW